ISRSVISSYELTNITAQPTSSSGRSNAAPVKIRPRICLRSVSRLPELVMVFVSCMDFTYASRRSSDRVTTLSTVPYYCYTRLRRLCCRRRRNGGDEEREDG